MRFRIGKLFFIPLTPLGHISNHLYINSIKLFLRIKTTSISREHFRKYTSPRKPFHWIIRKSKVASRSYIKMEVLGHKTSFSQHRLNSDKKTDISLCHFPFDSLHEKMLKRQWRIVRFCSTVQDSDQGKKILIWFSWIFIDNGINKVNKNHLSLN